MEFLKTAGRILTRREKKPVRQLLDNIGKRRGKDDFFQKLDFYLDWSLKCGLEGRHIADSCIDLAEALTTEPFYATIRDEKIAKWRSGRQQALSVERPARTINMKLDPLYFSLILERKKVFEGRSYNPDSQYNYPDIRKNDVINFTVDRRTPGWEAECTELDLDPEAVMSGTVQNLLFAPTVHWMYEFNPCEGYEFQPTFNGPSELLQIQRAAVYYTFPDYPARIRDHGFIGIEIYEPVLIS